MLYTFKLSIKKEQSRLTLLDDGKEVAFKEWPEERDMGRRLFETIAELLRENGLRSEQVSDFAVDALIADHFTSTRIAETVKRVYAFGTASSQNVDKEKE